MFSPFDSGVSLQMRRTWTTGPARLRSPGSPPALTGRHLNLWRKSASLPPGPDNGLLRVADQRSSGPWAGFNKKLPASLLREAGFCFRRAWDGNYSDPNTTR